jgi:4-hydroxymandelate oxidase
VFVARPPAGPPLRDLHLVRTVRRAFDGSAPFLADPRVTQYLTDMVQAYGRDLREDGPGHSYGEMARQLVESLVPAEEPVDLLILAFSIHDVRPGRQTAAYLSHVTPGTPMAFALCDQGCAAAFSGLRIARAYTASAAVHRALLIVVEQAALPYDGPAPLPLRHQGVALLFDDATSGHRVVGVRQHSGVPPADVAARAAADLADLACGHDAVTLVLGDALSDKWKMPDVKRVRAMPPGQPSTAVWWGLAEELAETKDLLVAADYDTDLQCLSLTAFDCRP